MGQIEIRYDAWLVVGCFMLITVVTRTILDSKLKMTFIFCSCWYYFSRCSNSGIIRYLYISFVPYHAPPYYNYKRIDRKININLTPSRAYQQDVNITSMYWSPFLHHSFSIPTPPNKKSNLYSSSSSTTPSDPELCVLT